MTRPAEPVARALFWLVGVILFAVLLAGGTVCFILSRPANRAQTAPP